MSYIQYYVIRLVISCDPISVIIVNITINEHIFMINLKQSIQKDLFHNNIFNKLKTLFNICMHNLICYDYGI